MIKRTKAIELGAIIAKGNLAPVINALRERVDYISDVDHPNHIGKEVCPARNFNCTGPSKENFMAAVKKLHAAYQKRGQGNRTKQYFGEIIYSTERGAHISPEERKLIEIIVMKDVCPHAAVRTAWHIDRKSGRADLHILFSATDSKLKAVFGRAIGNSILAFQRLDRQVVSMLNSNPTRKIRPLRAAIDVHVSKVCAKYNAKKPDSLGEQIAKKFPSKHIDAANLGDALERLGHDLVEIKKRRAYIRYKNCFNPKWVPLRNLLLQIGEAQVRINKRIRAKKMALLAKQIAREIREEINDDNILRVFKKLNLGKIMDKTTEKIVQVSLHNSTKIWTFSRSALLQSVHDAKRSIGPAMAEQPLTNLTTKKFTTGPLAKKQSVEPGPQIE